MQLRKLQISKAILEEIWSLHSYYFVYFNKMYLKGYHFEVLDKESQCKKQLSTFLTWKPLKGLALHKGFCLSPSHISSQPSPSCSISSTLVSFGSYPTLPNPHLRPSECSVPLTFDKNSLNTPYSLTVKIRHISLCLIPHYHSTDLFCPSPNTVGPGSRHRTGAVVPDSQYIVSTAAM